jgi:hypothetical protein
MGTKKWGFSVGEKDIAEPERIENHLKNLCLTGTVLSCTANPQLAQFKVEEFSLSNDSVKLIALKQFPPLHPDDIATFVYFSGHEPYRFGQRVVSADPGRGILLLHFPLVIRSNDRRSSRRITFPKREEIHTVIITDLGNGVGISGPLHDMGLGGGALLAEKMVLIPSGKEIRLGSESLKPGKVALIRFRLPGGLAVETAGNLIYTKPEAPAFRAGFQFTQKPPTLEAGLKKFLAGNFR